MYGLSEVFKRSGFASLSDLESPEHKEIFSILEIQQDLFLAKQNKFRSGEYKWPYDSLHTWSRVWEYPYVYYHLREMSTVLSPTCATKIVDLGSGVTFFPFAVAKLGFEVCCLDIDDVCGPDIERASAVVPHHPGNVHSNLISGGCLPLKDNEIGAVYCISVLEHIPDFELMIEEVFRILKPSGHFILTIDLDACGYMEIGVERYYKMRKYLDRHFHIKYPEIVVHPMDTLLSINGPYPLVSSSLWGKTKHNIKQRIKSLLGKGTVRPLPNLAVWGAIMSKKVE